LPGNDKSGAGRFIENFVAQPPASRLGAENTVATNRRLDKVTKRCVK
jgi:hypothetical protein